MLSLEVPLEEIPLLRYEKYHHPVLTVQKRAEIVSIQPNTHLISELFYSI